MSDVHADPCPSWADGLHCYEVVMVDEKGEPITEHNKQMIAVLHGAYKVQKRCACGKSVERTRE